MFVFSASVYLSIVALLFLINWRHLYYNPVIIFSAITSLEFIGFIQQAGTVSEADAAYALMAVLFFACFGLGSIAALARGRGIQDRQVHLEMVVRDTSSILSLVIAINIISAAVTVIYLSMAGGNFFLNALTNPTALAGDVAGRRFSYYQGATYLAPGYANQFKNFLLPISSFAIFAMAVIEKRKLLLLYSAGALIFSAVALLGTGQRQFLVYAAVGLAPTYIMFSRGSTILRLAGIAALFVAVLLFSLQSYFLGRVGGNSILHGLSELWQRLTVTQASGTVVGMRAYWPGPTDGLTRDWLLSLTSVLPGRTEGVQLANEVFYKMYGSTRGTAPMSIWASAWYNMGIAGGAVFSFVWGFIMGSVRKYVVSGRLYAARLSAWGGIVASLGGWSSAGPTVMLNTGLLAGAAMLIALQVISTRPQLQVSRVRRRVR